MTGMPPERALGLTDFNGSPKFWSKDVFMTVYMFEMVSTFLYNLEMKAKL